MTCGEYCRAANAAGRRIVTAGAEHERAVRKAVQEGNIVPGRVLADYPNLQWIAAQAGRAKAPGIADSMILGGGDNITPKQRAEYAYIAGIVGALGGGPAGSGNDR
jgi:hypothetical protein